MNVILLEFYMNISQLPNKDADRDSVYPGDRFKLTGSTPEVTSD